MGGAESEVAGTTVNVLLEGASWEFINIRRTAKAHNLPSEASYRFSRGVHPALAERGVLRALELMRQWAGGTVARGLVDSYPGRTAPPTVEITTSFVERQLGVALSADQIVGILRSLEFVCDVCPRTGGQAGGQAGDVTVRVTAPDHRLDIGTGVIGQADVLEEIARIYGYERIPETMLAEVLPTPHVNQALVLEERVRDLLVSLGLQEIVTYSLTSPEREARMVVDPPPDARSDYIRLANPIVVDRVVMRQALLPGVLDIASANARHTDRLALFEIGPVYLPVAGAALPDEPVRLSLVVAGPRSASGWQPADHEPVDFFDLKGTIETLLGALHLRDVAFVAGDHASLTPGRSAQVTINGLAAGWLGELHPAVAARFDLASRVLVAELDLAAITSSATDRHPVSAVPAYPPVKEDLAVIVDDGVPAAQVADVIRRSGGALVGNVSLFDLYRGDQVGGGKKSLAFSVTYQATDRTLTDVEAAKVRDRIVRALTEEIGGVLRA
jgi:phenylalanyl-tRNA synthetase beta chain